MNRENILAVADAIEKHSIPDLGFNMGALIDVGPADMSGRECGTVACIAGWAVCLQKGRIGSDGSYILPVLEPAAKWLGLDETEAIRLFTWDGNGSYDRFTRTTDREAVSVLRHLAETGEVDWDRALAGPSK